MRRSAALLQALRDNEQRVQSLGYNTFRLKFEAFVIMGGVVGYAGALLAFMLRGAYADNLSWQHAGDSLLMTVLGGVHHFLGPLWGAIAFILLEDRLSAITESWWLMFAPIVIVFALASPEGMQGLVFRAARPRRLDADAARHAAAAGDASSRGAAERRAPRCQPSRCWTVRGLHKRFGSLVVAQDVQSRRASVPSAQPDRPERRGQDDVLQHADRPAARRMPATIRFDGHDITHLPVHRRIRLGLGRSFQILSVFRNLTTFENVRVAVQAQSPQQNSACGATPTAIDDVNARTWSLLAAVGLEDRAAEPCANLSHGEQRLLEIAIALATDAKLLLLDEPLAGLAEADREVVGALIRQLAATHAVLLIEHDIDRVLALSDRITVLHQGRVIADGKPAEVASNPDVITAYMGTATCRRPAADRARRTAPRAAATKPLLALDTGARRLCRQPGADRSRSGRARGRGGGAAGPQRRRQDDDAARDHRHGAEAAPGSITMDGADITHAPAVRDQSARASPSCRRDAGCSPT